VDVLATAARLARDVLAPRATETDLASVPPADNIRRLADAGLLGVSTPPEYGGLGADAALHRAFVETIAAACGTTAFVLFQHLGACRHVASGEDAAMRARLLPALARGERFCTLAFSHLRRPGPPAVRVERDGDGFVFDGTAPWCTGKGVADDVLLAGTLESGDTVWVVVPLVESAALHAGEPLRLCAANASATVTLECRALRVPGERFVKTMTQAQLAADTAGAILYFTALSLGVTRAAIALIRERAEGPRRDVLTATADALEQEAGRARDAVNRAEQSAPEFADAAVELRAWCIDLGVRAAHAAVIVGSGAANILDSPAQRLYREAMLYTLTAQTWPLQQASLRRLVARDGR